MSTKRLVRNLHKSLKVTIPSPMLAINTNIRAQFSHAALAMIERRQSASMEQLSTGKRINSARDDAAGLAIATRMSEVIRGTNQAIKNANDGINLIQTADGAIGQIVDMLQRMRELAVQSATDTYTDEQRGYIDLEYQQLKQQIVQIANRTQWNGMSILNASAGTPAAPPALYKTGSSTQWLATPGSAQVPQKGDLILNGFAIDPLPDLKPDPNSPPDDAASSASNKVALINHYSDRTGVQAVLDVNRVAGSDMTLSAAPIRGNLIINGYQTVEFSTSTTRNSDTRQSVVDAVNAISYLTGVKATDTLEDGTGVTLTAADGRNIQVDMSAGINTADFQKALGVRKGVQTGSFSLATQHGQALMIDATTGGDLSRWGLQRGQYTSSNVSTITINPGLLASQAADVRPLQTNDLVINGVKIPASSSLDDGLSHLTVDTSSRFASAMAIAAAINSQTAQTRVTALVDPVNVQGNALTTDYAGTATLYINGTPLTLALGDHLDASDRKQYVMDTINADKSLGVEAYDNLTDGIGLRAVDGRNVSLGYLSDTDLNATEFGLGVRDQAGSAPLDATGIFAFADALDYTQGPTLYAAIMLQSAGNISIRPGSNGYSEQSNFSALGFKEQEFNATADVSGRHYEPPQVSRMTFQIGSHLNQSLDVYMPDLSDQGAVTHAVTWDVQMETDARAQWLRNSGTNKDWEKSMKDAQAVLPTFFKDETLTPKRFGMTPEPVPSTLITQGSSEDALGSIDSVIDQLGQVRSTFGASVNRLEHSVSNLSTYYVNMSASRSRIEDANYAEASSEMAKAQIMQQAATAVLAQANTSQQIVLKLLQNA